MGGNKSPLENLSSRLDQILEAVSLHITLWAMEGERDHRSHDTTIMFALSQAGYI